MKNTISRALNFALYLSFCLMVATGLVIAFRLPSGRAGGRGLSLFGFDRHQWGDIHLWISYGFIALIIIHLFLHWKWLVKIASSNRPWRLWLGLGVGTAIILIVLLFPVASRFH